MATDTALEQVTEDRIITKAAQNLAGASRILIGFVFLWAFLDKTFGLGYATKAGTKCGERRHNTAGRLVTLRTIGFLIGLAQRS